MHSSRRLALPEKVHQIWDCVEHGHAAAGALVDVERLLSVATAIHKMSKEEFVDELEKAVSDGLVVSEIVDNKGNEVEVFSLPDPKALEKGDHDWYCFSCHLGGTVFTCEDCPRAFHLDCLPENRRPEKDLFVCPCCHMKTTKPSMSKVSLKPKVLNSLLSYICERFNQWQIPFLVTADPKIWASEAKRAIKEAWRFNMLVYTPIDLTIMTEKAASGRYVSLEEFQVDCETLVHAMGSYFGNDVLKGSSTGAAFIRDALHDIQEIKLCHDCFRRSNEKDHPWWFCLPCATPHSVVWAKQSGYPFWPAKVMKQDGNKYDVRYFGGGYERALIDIKNIHPIETSLTVLKVRKTALWNDAFDELQKFMDIAKDPRLVDSLPSRGGKSSAKGKSTSKGMKRSATSEDRVLAKKSRGSDQTPKRPLSGRSSSNKTLSGGSTPATASTSSASISANGMSTPRKKVYSSPMSALTRREMLVVSKPSPSPIPTPSATMSTLGKQERIVSVSGSVVDDISFDTFFDEVAENDLCGDATYSDDDEKDLSHKDSEDAVSSSCNASLASRHVYVQVTTSVTQSIDAAKKKFEEYSKEVKEHFMHEINSNKKKQWCFNCDKEAIYHCCWNTAYCSTECQQTHWTKEHKRLCRRVRRERSGGSGTTGHGSDDY